MHRSSADLSLLAGAPDTFDGPALIAKLAQVRDGSDSTVMFPSFDHAVGDPVPDQIVFDRKKHKVRSLSFACPKV